MKGRQYKARTIAGATARVRQLEENFHRLDQLAMKYKKERDLLAQLAARTPQFDNPLEAIAAESLRDAILGGRA